MQQTSFQTILVVDDSRVIQLTVRKVLQDADFAVRTAQSGEEALELIRRYGLPHLALVDINMPGGMDGFAFAAELHRFSDVPVIMLTAVDDEKTVVEGLQHHAEDYVVKPFRSTELVARIRRVLGRVGDFDYTFDPEIVIDADLAIDLPAREARVGDKTVSLTPTEARLLYILINNAGRVVRTEYLLRRLWPLEQAFEDRLHQHVRRLRKKIEANPREPRYIQTEWGTGYRFKPFRDAATPGTHRPQ